MEEVSWYATIICIILLHISYYWFIRNHYLTKRMRRDDIGNNKLALLLHSTPNQNLNNKLSESLRVSLELEKFIVYQVEDHVEVDGNGVQDFSSSFITISGPNSLVQLNFSQINEMVGYFETQLKSQGQKLHAFISVSSNSDCYSGGGGSDISTFKKPYEEAEISQGCCNPQPLGNRLSALMSHSSIVRQDGARVIQVRDILLPLSPIARFQTHTTTTTNLCKLFESFGARICLFLGLKPSRVVNQKRVSSIDVKIQKAEANGGRSDTSAASITTANPPTMADKSSSIKSLVSHLNNGTCGGLTGNEPVMRSTTNISDNGNSRDGIHPSACVTSSNKIENDPGGGGNDVLVRRLVDAIVSLVVRVNPATRKIVN